jgi:hypothetical protein
MQGRVFLDTPGTCAATPTILAQEAVNSSLVPPDDAEAIINMRMWPASISLGQDEFGYMEFRSVELALSSGALASLSKVAGQPNVLLQVCLTCASQGYCFVQLVMLAVDGMEGGD